MSLSRLFGYIMSPSGEKHAVSTAPHTGGEMSKVERERRAMEPAASGAGEVGDIVSQPIRAAWEPAKPYNPDETEPIVPTATFVEELQTPINGEPSAKGAEAAPAAQISTMREPFDVGGSRPSREYGGGAGTSLYEPLMGQESPTTRAAASMMEFWGKHGQGFWHKDPQAVLTSKVMWLLFLCVGTTTALVLTAGMEESIRSWTASNTLTLVLPALAGGLLPVVLMIWHPAREHAPWNAISLVVLVLSESLLLAAIAARLPRTVALPTALPTASALLLLFALVSLAPGGPQVTGALPAFVTVVVVFLVALTLGLANRGDPETRAPIILGALGALALTDFLFFSAAWNLSLQQLEGKRQRRHLNSVAVALDVFLAPFMALITSMDRAERAIGGIAPGCYAPAPSAQLAGDEEAPETPAAAD